MCLNWACEEGWKRLRCFKLKRMGGRLVADGMAVAGMHRHRFIGGKWGGGDGAPRECFRASQAGNPPILATHVILFVFSIMLETCQRGGVPCIRAGVPTSGRDLSSPTCGKSFGHCRSAFADVPSRPGIPSGLESQSNAATPVVQASPSPSGALLLRCRLCPGNGAFARGATFRAR
jgi:hypothetical protein